VGANLRKQNQCVSRRPDPKAPKPLRIEYVSTSSLRPNPKNPRIHSKKQVLQIAQSVGAFGFNVPILVDSTGTVIAGHGRLEAAKLKGIASVPIIRLQHLSEAQVRAFLIADNRLTEIAVWDDKLLAEQFRALAEVDLNFNLEATGFEVAEIDAFIENAEIHADDASDVIPEPSAARVSKSGDLWLLDKHRVLCGDALKTESFKKLMDGKKASAVFIDPPYNDPVDRYVSNFGKVKHPEFAMASGEMTSGEFTAFLEQAFRNLAAASISGSLHFVAMDWRHLPELLAAGAKAYTEFKNLCVWVKNTAGQGSLYRSQHELVAVFKLGKESHRNNIQLGMHGRYRTNIWQYDRVNGAAGSSGQEEGLAELHPTIKPVQLVADAILDTTARKDVVLDAFLGSGTTVIAAERTGRICYGLEIDPAYVDTIVRRWQIFTGKAAVYAKSGKTFREMEEEATCAKKK
jgi:DNA modification methylase